jgi:hypothetical protein
MNRTRNIFGVLILLTICAACTKQTCPDYWKYPDCKTESRERFYGLYRGISLMENEQPVMTQWKAEPTEIVSELRISPTVILILDPKDTRVFKVKDSSRMNNNLYIRHEGFGGRFTDDSLYLDFWVDQGIEQTPGEQRWHYTFAGMKK